MGLDNAIDDSGEGLKCWLGFLIEAFHCTEAFFKFISSMYLLFVYLFHKNIYRFRLHAKLKLFRMSVLRAVRREF